MSRPLTVARGQLGIETINIFKMRCRRVQSMAVNDEMTVIANADFFAGQTDETLDVKFIVGNVVSIPLVSRNPSGFKDNGISARRLVKIVAQTVNEQMVSGGHPQFDDIVALMENPSLQNPRTISQRVYPLRWFAVIRRKPERVFNAGKRECLLDVKNEEMSHRPDRINRAIRRCDKMDVGISLEPFLDALPAGRKDHVIFRFGDFLKFCPRAVILSHSQRLPHLTIIR